VTKVIKNTWPIKPDFSAADPEVLENARDRGVVVDDLFSAYVNGTLTKIPGGTRRDAVDLFLKLQKWWDKRGVKARSQVMLADDEIAGTCDIITEDGWIYDVKATYNIEPTYPIQLGAYAHLHGAWPKGIGIIHVTKRFEAPKLIELSLTQCLGDWVTVRALWQVVERRK
jgi:hypothetical protein